MDRRRTLLVDTNLLVLFVVGSVDPHQIARFKRTRTYTAEDFGLVVRVMAQYTHFVTTPNVLTEVSNLTGQLWEPLRSTARAFLQAMLSTLDEELLPSIEVTQESTYRRLGLTDAAVIRVAREKCAVLTDDLDLYLALAAEGVEVTNFSHLRSELL